MSSGKLYLIPTELAENSTEKVLPSSIFSLVDELDFFAVENIRSARRFIRRASEEKVIDSIQFEVFDKNSVKGLAENLLLEVLQGRSLGVLSEAGCPGIADPGAVLVEKAHEMGVKVVPMVGPSSILLALIASGMNGQNFAFSGYLPIQDGERASAIKKLDKEIYRSNQTQIFMETPYRNDKLLKDLTKFCNPKTKLCVACNITAEDEYIETMSIQDWKKMKVNLHKKPVMFVLGK